MAYNPGISYRGEMLGQAIGQAGQSIAQSYGQGLKLAEMKKNRDKLETAERKRAEVYVDTLFEGDEAKAMKAQMKGWEAADISGWVAGQTDALNIRSQQASYETNKLQLGKLEDDLKQDPIMKRAMSDMTMYLTEQNLSPQDALNSAVQQNPELSPDSRLKLNKLVQARQSIANQGDVLRLRDLATQIDQVNANTNAMNAQTNSEIAAANEKQRIEAEKRRGQGVQTYDIPGSDSVVVEFPSGEGTRSQIVDAADTGDDDINTQRQSASISKQAETAYEEADQIATGGGADPKTGDERTGFGGNRYTRLGKQFSKLRQMNSQYRASNNKDHPQYTEFLNRMIPLVTHMRTQRRDNEDLGKMLTAIGVPSMINQMRSEGRNEEAKSLAAKFGIDYTR